MVVPIKKKPGLYNPAFGIRAFVLLSFRYHSTNAHVNYGIAVAGVVSAIAIHIYPFEAFVYRKGNNDIDITRFITSYHKG